MGIKDFSSKSFVVLVVVIVALVLAIVAWNIRAFGPPKPPKPVAPEEVSSQKPVPSLTEEEKTRAVEIIEQDKNLKQILERANWDISFMEPRYKNGQKVGATVNIKFKPSLWIEGEFTDLAGQPAYRAKLWAGSLLVLVDFENGKVTAINPGLGKPRHKMPLNATERRAERIALRHPLATSLGKGSESYLGGVWYAPGYPKGLAIFEVGSGKEAVLIAVDLDSLEVVEELTGRLLNAEER